MRELKLIAIGLFFIGIALTLRQVKSYDMKVCELSHSADVCFSTLNR